jgi:hypothetical protein
VSPKTNTGQPETLVYKFRLGERVLDLDFYEITLDESILLEKTTNTPWPYLCDQLDKRAAIAVKAFYWLARVKAGEEIGWIDEEWNLVRWREFRVEVDLGHQEHEAAPEEGEAPDPPKTVAQPRATTGSGSAKS